MDFRFTDKRRRNQCVAVHYKVIRFSVEKLWQGRRARNQNSIYDAKLKWISFTTPFEGFNQKSLSRYFPKHVDFVIKEWNSLGMPQPLNVTSQDIISFLPVLDLKSLFFTFGSSHWSEPNTQVLFFLLHFLSTWHQVSKKKK